MTGYFVGKALVVVIVGLVGVFGAIGRAQRRAAVRAKLVAAPSTFEDNALVTFTGTVKPLGEPLIAPLSGKPCVAYRAVARTYALRNPGSAVLARSLSLGILGSGRAVDREVVEVKLAPFVLATKAGDVIVEGELSELLLPVLPLIPRKVEREQTFLNRMEVDAQVRTASFDECRVELGAKIKVHGVSRSKLAGDKAVETGFREAPTQIRLSGDDAHPLTIDRA